MPTYRSIGDHTETIEIDFDPSVTSYEAMLEVFFSSHNACARPWSRQYMSAIFTHGNRQLKLAQARAKVEAGERGSAVGTVIEAAGRFYLAEDYHQKYYLRSHQQVTDELLAIYPVLKDFVDSTSVTRLNGYVGGHGTPERFAKELPKFGLSPAATERVRALGSGLHR